MKCTSVLGGSSNTLNNGPHVRDTIGKNTTQQTTYTRFPVYFKLSEMVVIVAQHTTNCFHCI